MTGASGGVGRATAHAFAKRGAQRGVAGPRRTGAVRDAARGAGAWRRGARAADRCRAFRAGRGGGRGRRNEIRADRHLGQRRDGNRVRAVHRDLARGVQARDRSDVPRHGVRDDGGTQADDGSRPWDDHPGRVGALLPLDPAPGGVLRRQVRDPRLHGLDPQRAAARPQQRPHHDGPAAGSQHDPVQLVPVQAPRPSTAGAPDLPARDPGRGRVLGRRTIAAASCASATARSRRSSAARSPPGLPIATSPARRSRASRSQDMPVAADRPNNLFSPVPELAATHGIFDERPSAAARSCGPTPTAAALAGAALGAAAAGRPGSSQRACDERRAPAMSHAAAAAHVGAPHILREYALLADGERGVLVGPRGDYAWMCFPRWDSDACFATLIGGGGVYAVTPAARFVWGGYYEHGLDLAQPLGHRRRRRRMPRSARRARTSPIGRSFCARSGRSRAT